MSIVGSLVAFGFRQVVDVDVAPLLDRVEAHLADHSQALPAALARANDRAWQAVGLAVGGSGVLGFLQGLFAGGDLKGVRDLLREFLERTPTGLETTPADLRARCQEEWQRLYRGGRLTIGPDAARQLARRAGDFQRFTDLPGLVGESQRAVAGVADALRADAPNLAAVLGHVPPGGGPPLLVAAFLFFFRREVEDNPALARGLTFESLRRLTAELDHGLQALDQALRGLGGRLDGLFAALAEGFDRLTGELRDIRGKLDRLVAENQVRTSPTSPLNVSVTSEQERAQLRKLRDRLRQLPPGVAGTEDWLLLGDGLAAAGEFDDARASHEQAAATAHATADREREAEAHFKAYRDACEQREWANALAALRQAVELDAARFRPFDTRRYEVVSILGAGGFGTVFRARDRYRKDEKGQAVEVALKTLHTADLARDLDEVFAEAHLLNQLRHGGIIRVIDQNFADPDGQKRPYLVLEYFAAPTLEAYLRQKGPLPLDDVLAIARQVAAAVHAAHQARVFHRDLKPANILARRHKDGTWRVKVIDFGLAVRIAAAVQASSVLAGAKGALRDQSFAGTLDYAAPEQKGKLPGVSVGPYSDVYGFGKTCLDALFRTTEVVSDHWEELADPRRDAVRKLLEKCIVTDLKRRHGSFEPVLAELDKLTGKPVPVAPPPPPPPPPYDPLQRAADEERRFQETVRRMADNLARWLATDQPRAWVACRLAGFAPKDWDALLAELRRSPFWPMNADDARSALETLRSRLLVAQVPPPENRQPGDLLTLPIRVPDPAIQPGEPLTLKFTIADPARPPGALAVLGWKPVPARPNPHATR
jgi:serine/threonine protein kinase